VSQGQQDLEPAVWTNGALTFWVGVVTTWDLASNLPDDVIKGGIFGVSQTGAPLPPGMILAPSGLLSLGTAMLGRADGVVFTYTEPMS
jgi:hypothetical protein